MEPAVTQNPSLTGYKSLNVLYEGKRTLVYRAVRTVDQCPVVIKTSPQHLTLSFSDHLAFRNQFTIGHPLDHPGLVPMLSLESVDNTYALVMADVQGMSLEDSLQFPLAPALGLQIAIQLADILHYLNQERVIHKDIKPANILIDPDHQQVYLIDFSLSSLLSKETQEIKNPSVLEGTLAYMAPEQTGRMNRGIDFRSDFYGLGVTLFELFAGQLPFQASEPMAWVHCHIAQQPPSLSQFGVPEAISAIVFKLMAKNAEERYQSALGLKHDLESCLAQLQGQGDIQAFKSGARDVCDCFLIPEKLYGREAEVQTLLAAFDRVAQGSSELMLVAGFSGIGKTAVVNEVHKPITRQQGYFVKGKFDQFNRNIPFSAFVQAFRCLMGQLLGESDADLAEWKTKILGAVGESGQVLIEVIPELKHIIGEQPPVPELSGPAAQNRFNLLLGQFIQIFTHQDHPLVMFLDDLQWADSASLSLLHLLMAKSETGYLLILGAYRDNEVFPAHPLMLTLDEIRENGLSLQTLTLAPLAETDINQLVADTLICSVELAAPLSQLMYQNTRGNPFFTTQFLQGLHGDDSITFDAKVGYWQCDFAQVQQLALTEDVVEFMVGQLQKLPKATQNVLKLAACIGNRFTLETLAVVSEQSQDHVADNLWRSLQAGFVIPESETYKFFLADGQTPQNTEHVADISVEYHFLHDRVQQAAYALIQEGQTETTHYRIGQLLLEQILPEAREERIFELVSQLNYGKSLISNQVERDHLAHLNLIACRKARTATAYQGGREYAQMGLLLLGDQAWQRQYDMTLAFHDLAAELASLCGNTEDMEQWMAAVIAQAHTLLDQSNVYRTKILAHVSQGQFTEALVIAQQFLQALDVVVPEDAIEDVIRQGVVEVNQLLGDRPVADLVNLPVMVDAKTITIVEIANSILPAAYLSGSPLFPILILLAVKLSIQYGNTPASAHVYICYAILACNLLKDVDTGVEFGQLALQVAIKLDAKTVKPDVLSVAGLFILHRKFPMQDTLPRLQEGYVAALEVGKLEFVGYTAYKFCLNSYWCGRPLERLQQDARTYCSALVQFNQLTTANYCRIFWQSTLNLSGAVENPMILSGVAMQETDILPQLQAAHDVTGLHFFHLHKLMLCYLFGAIDTAQIQATETRRYLADSPGTAGEPAFYFYDSLTVLATLDGNRESSAGQAICMEQVNQNQAQLQQYWAHYAPMNYQHKVDLVEAEKSRILGQKSNAIEFYDRAIAGAKANQYLQEEALANELAAKFYLDWSKEKIAAVYMQEAYSCYTCWGAQAKTDALEQRYPDLLQPILQQRSQPLNPLDTLASLVDTNLSIHASISATSTRRTLNTALDLAALLKSAQALSENLHLDELLEQLTQMMLQNSGADSLVLLLPETDGSWHIRATAIPEATRLTSEPLAGNPNIPVQLIQYVQHTQEILVVDDLDTDFLDDYLQQHQPRSVLCLPIRYQGNLSGLLYLQNQSTAGVFTCDRITVLNFLCSQAAISIENARLYESVALKSTIIESAVDGMAILEDGKYIYLNEVHATLFGYKREELLGQSCEILYSPTELQRLHEIAFPIVAKTGQWSGEAMATRKDSSSFTLEVSLLLLDDDKLICICRDISDRNRATAALALSEARLNAAFEQAAMGFTEIDIKTGKFIRVNTLFCELTGYTKAEFAAMKMSEITHPEDVAASMQAIQKLYSGEIDNFILEKRYLRKDGTYFWAETTVCLVKLQGREAVYSLGMVQDISDRKATEKALSLTQFAVENAATSLFWINEAGGFLEVNEAACQVLGYSPEELMEKSIWEIDPNFPCEAWPEHWQTLKECSYQQFESHHQTKDHRLFPVEITSNYLEYDGQGFIFAQVQDIGKRKQAETALQFTQYSVDNAADCTFWIKPNGKFAYANQAASTMHGYSIDELMLMSVFEINPNMTSEGWKWHWQKVKQQGSYSLETEHQSKAGRVFPVEVVVNFLEFDGDEFNFVRVRDISDRKAAEAELYQLNTDLEQRVQARTQELSEALATLKSAQVSLVESEKMAALGTLVAGVAHEINTPIGTSITVASTLADETEIFLQAMEAGQLKRSVVNRYLDVARRCSMLLHSNLDRAGELIQSFKQVAVDQSHCERRTFNLKAYLQEVVTSLHPQVKRSGHQLHLTGSDAITLTNDPGIFAQIVTNLVTNSIKHGYPNGDSGQLQLQIDRQDQQIVLTYRDDGCGIPSEHLSKVYEPFFTTARRHGGTGLGLNIVYNIVCQSLKGTIELDSQEGEGTLFRIVLPYN